ncbi:MAG: hypothetical protein PHE28_04680 [Bacteroidales bacterium]|nr:hypothetical protein [Bacteroidales bacterium]
MNIYLKDLFSRIKSYSKQLDAEAILYNKKWLFITENGEQVVYIFRPNNELIVTLNGIGVKGRWEILFDNTISIEVKEEIRIYNAAFVEEKFLALQLDSNNRFDVLVEKSIQEQNYITNLEESIKYIDNKYKQLELELVVQKEIENQKKLLEENAKQELLKRQEQEKQEKERVLLTQQREEENKSKLSEEEEQKKIRKRLEEIEGDQQAKIIAFVVTVILVIILFIFISFQDRA